MARRMRVTAAPLVLLALVLAPVAAFIPGVDGPITKQEALEGGNATLLCDTASSPGDEFMLIVWYKNNVPIYSYEDSVEKEWSADWFNISGRLTFDLQSVPTALTVGALTGDDQALYHCRVDFLLSPTRNLSVNLTVIELPSKPFFLDEVGNKVENKVGPYHEGDNLVLTCLVIGGRPTPRITWYSGETLVDATDGLSDIPGVRANDLFLPLTRNTTVLTCRASNTKLAIPVETSLEVELFLPAYNVSIHWESGVTTDNTLQAGRAATVLCRAEGSYPAPDLSWWLDHRHLTQHSNQSWSSSTKTALSHLELTPSVLDNGATFACVATNPAMAPSRGSRADVITLNVTYSPIVEVLKVGEGGINQIIELDPLHLECDVRANPPVDRFTWYFNDHEIVSRDIWGEDTWSRTLVVEEVSRQHAGSYACAARNSVGETRAEALTITVLYPPGCTGSGISLVQETLHCNVKSLPAPDTYFWHIQPFGLDVQDLTTGSAILPLSQLTGALPTPLKIKCEANNGIASQEKSCDKSLSLEHLRPPQPQQCDIAFEYKEFQMRCIPVENATYYEVSVWRMSSSNASLVLERRGSMGLGGSAALGRGGPWLVRGPLGPLRAGDEAAAAACNRYGCSRPTLLRPTDVILQAGEQPWWHFFLEKDAGIALGVVVLVTVFVLTTLLSVRLARRQAKPAPVIQVLQLDDAAREYIESIGERRLRSSRSLRSCSSDYSEGSLEGSGPIVDRRRKPAWDQWDPPPDVTLTLHRESAV